MMMTGARQHGTTTAVPTSSSSSPASMAATPQPPRSKPFFTATQRARFEEDGFVVVERLIDPTVAHAIRNRFPLLFRGEFDTGVYPDEWHWREGMGREDITREIVNSWKSDRTIASVVLSQRLGQIVTELTEWRGTRVGQDDIWWKPPGTKAISFHQDAPYFDFINPRRQLLTCWIALDDTSRTAGTLEYVRGSHKWPQESKMLQNAFFTAENYRASLDHAAKQLGLQPPEVVPVEVPVGGAAFHSGPTWHGSGVNKEKDRVRRSLAIHFLPSHATFQPTGVGYIYGRYKVWNSVHMEETFFPITYRVDGYRSSFIASYCHDAL